jgi:hypothetical protein
MACKTETENNPSAAVAHSSDCSANPGRGLAIPFEVRTTPFGATNITVYGALIELSPCVYGHSISQVPIELTIRMTLSRSQCIDGEFPDKISCTFTDPTKVETALIPLARPEETEGGRFPSSMGRNTLHWDLGQHNITIHQSDGSAVEVGGTNVQCTHTYRRPVAARTDHSADEARLLTAMSREFGITEWGLREWY